MTTTKTTTNNNNTINTNNVTDNTITKVSVQLYAAKLKNVAGFEGLFKGISNPFAVVTLLPHDPKEKPQKLGQTEV